MSPADSPWLTATEAANYIKRGKRFVQREIHAGRLRGAVVGGRREILTRRDWLDDWVVHHATPIELNTRRRA